MRWSLNAFSQLLLSNQWQHRSHSEVGNHCNYHGNRICLVNCCHRNVCSVLCVEVGMCLANHYLVMGDFTVETMLNRPLAGNGRLQNVLSFWQREVVRICQSYWRVTLTPMWKIIAMKDTFELDVLPDLSQETTSSNYCTDMVFGRNVDNLSCMNYVSYFSYHRPILITTNHQAPQLTDVPTNYTLWVISINNVLYIYKFFTKVSIIM
jgi:hypothetical protein